MLTENLLQNWQ